MRFFFKSKRFKIISAIAAVLFACVLIFGFATGWAAPGADFMSSVFTPVQRWATSVSSSIGSFSENFRNSEEYKKEIGKLEEELAEKDKQLIDRETIIRQNKFFKEFLDIKEENPDYKFTDAMVIARNTADPYYTFTIDKGTLGGVSVYDPVITSKGLVGYISDAYSTQSTVITVINPDINISAIDNRTRDSGNVAGSMEYASKGLGTMMYVSNKNTMAAGDYIVTSGAGGVFPKGLFIGTVSEVKTTATEISSFAIFEPTVELEGITDVMVITDFDGKKALGE